MIKNNNKKFLFILFYFNSFICGKQKGINVKAREFKI